jgi:hypothetical protein
MPRKSMAWNYDEMTLSRDEQTPSETSRHAEEIILDMHNLKCSHDALLAIEQSCSSGAAAETLRHSRADLNQMREFLYAILEDVNGEPSDVAMP